MPERPSADQRIARLRAQLAGHPSAASQQTAGSPAGQATATGGLDPVRPLLVRCGRCAVHDNHPACQLPLTAPGFDLGCCCELFDPAQLTAAHLVQRWPPGLTFECSRWPNCTWHWAATDARDYQPRLARAWHGHRLGATQHRCTDQRTPTGDQQTLL